MPFKYFRSRRNIVYRSSEKKRNWSAYNKRMKMRGDIAIWLSPDVVENGMLRIAIMMVMARQIYIVTWQF